MRVAVFWLSVFATVSSAIGISGAGPTGTVAASPGPAAALTTEAYDCTGDDRVPPNPNLDPANFLPEDMGLPKKTVTPPPAAKLTLHLVLQRDATGGVAQASAQFGVNGGASLNSLGTAQAIPIHRWADDFVSNGSRPNVMGAVLNNYPNLYIGDGVVVGDYEGTAFTGTTTVQVTLDKAPQAFRLYVNKFLSSNQPFLAGVPLDYIVRECHRAGP